MIKNIYSKYPDFVAWKYSASQNPNHLWAQRFLKILEEFELAVGGLPQDASSDDLKEALAEIKVQKEAIELQKTDIDVLKSKLYEKSLPAINTLAKLALDHRAIVGSLNALRNQNDALVKENQALRKMVDEVGYLIHSGYDDHLGEDIETLYRLYSECKND